MNDYIADTRHLRTIDHGAYLLLIMHYWRTGSLPQDDRQLARIAGLSLRIWMQSVRPRIEPLFRSGWKHKRIDYELERQEIIRTKRAIAGQKGGNAFHKADNFLLPSRHKYQSTLSNDFNGGFEANAKQTASSHSHIRKKEASEEERKIEASPELEKILQNRRRLNG